MEINDQQFREAVTAIDRGNIGALKDLIGKYPRLITDRLPTPHEKGYFSNPYLLWFVAGNPVRNDTLPVNSVEVARVIIEALKHNSVSALQEQLDYTLALVCSGRVPRECGVQFPLIDLLIDNGADPDHGLNPAVTHCEIAAVEKLIKRGASLTLLAAIATNRKEDIRRLSQQAGTEERQSALAVAALYGQADTLALLIDLGVNVNDYCPDGFHSHSIPLHQAVGSGSLEAVKVLVEAGSDLRIRDKIYFGIPLGWAQYGNHTTIAAYLRERMASRVAESLLAAGVIQKSEFEKAVIIIATEFDI
jgi:peptide-methionine (S)-S-oxide reductase